MRTGQVLPTVNGNTRARDVGGQGRGKERRDIGDVFQLAHPAQRGHRLPDRFGAFPAHPVHTFGALDRSGHDAVRPDPVASPFESEVRHQVVDPGLGRADMGLIGKGHIGLPARDKQQGPPRLPQLLEAGMGGVECAEQVDLDHGAEALGRNGFGRRDKVAGGPANCKADRPERLAATRNGGLHGRIIAHVGNRSEDRGTARFKFLAPRVEPLRRAPADADTGSQPGQCLADRQIDPAAADFPKGQTIGRAIVDAVGAAGGQAAISADGSFAARPDVAVVVVGEQPYAEFQGDIPHLGFKPLQGEDKLVARLKAQGIPVVVVFLSGRPLFTGSLLNQADAFVAAWLPGSQGQGVADVLVAGKDGKSLRDFTGRLAYPWPDDARSPIAKPLFPLGYGLSYGTAGALGRVNEDPRIDLSQFDTSTSFFVRGKALAPWHISNDGSITVRAVDLSAQEDARQYTWSGTGALTIEGNPVNLGGPISKGSLMLEWRIDRRSEQFVTVSLGGVDLFILPQVRAAPLGTVIKTRIPLRCFKQGGADLSSVGQPFRIKASTGFAMTLRTVRIEPTATRMQCPFKVTDRR